MWVMHGNGRSGASTVPDLAGALRHARTSAARLPAWLGYHDRAHTFSVVVPAARRLALEEGVDRATLVLVTVAACFHDLGFLEAYEGHEDVSRRMACETLPRFGFVPAQVDAVAGMIEATRLPQRPRTLAERVVADADLVVLGRHDFLTFNRRLRAEVERHRGPMSDAAWYEAQLTFLESHRYFTRTAQRMLGPREELNRVQLRALFASARRSAGEK